MPLHERILVDDYQHLHTPLEELPNSGPAKKVPAIIPA